MQLDVVLYRSDGLPPSEAARAALARAIEAVAPTAVPLLEPTGPTCAALNAAAAKGSGEWLLFLDTACGTGGFLVEAMRAIAAQPEAAGFECRQLPWETQQHIDPVTLETPYVNGAAMLLRRSAFEAAGRFDTRLSGEAANVDLSWRLRAAGGLLYYLPQALVMLEDVAAPAETLNGYAAEVLGRLLLAWKYGRPGDIWRAQRAYWKTLKNPRHFAGVRKKLAKQYLKSFVQRWPLLFWRFGHCQLWQNTPANLAEDHFAPLRGQATLEAPVQNGPLISVVIRTHKRAARLRGALQSVANQTYPNYEVIVIEDGETTAEAMIKAEFAHLPLRYHATGQNIGRSAAGNLGFAMAQGAFINLLDDDDYFYPDHLERVAAQALAHPQAELLFCDAMAVKMKVLSEDPFRFEASEYAPIHIGRLDVFTMAQACQVHVAAVAFGRQLFVRHGGFDETLPAHEDWQLWMRYLAVAKRAHPGQVDVPRATTVFTQPASAEEARRRMQQYMQADSRFFDDGSLRFDLTLAEMRGFYDGVLADILHVQALGQLDDYLHKQQTREVERD